jgi:IS4 transposase
MTIKELHPELTSDQRRQVGDIIASVEFVNADGYKHEDGYTVRTYPEKHYEDIRALAHEIMQLVDI